ncbi:uncharacterized protein LOC119292359 isoform X2 [Triticum dicoccoides]|uniref:uncharacterized protein LOC119292359 isoform X2 n=1 Tax=Triticum dicoccoides TaxID=85692 RepID=UPI000E7CD8C5|nr:uncharacterized protein LOC119292359 isoform X2 [Triticum dicoccoides]
MGDVSTIQRPSGTAAKQGDQAGELVSAGWTNDTHNMYISSMEASFMQQLRGQQQQHHHAAPDRNIAHVGLLGHGLKSHQEGASDNARAERNVSCPRDVGARGLPEDPWARRFKPRDSAMNRRGDGVGASDGESGTDTVQGMAPKHGRGVGCCVGGNLADKTSEVCGQNFPEDEVHSAAQPSKSCKKRRPASSTAAGSFISMLGDKRW